MQKHKIKTAINFCAEIAEAQRIRASEFIIKAQGKNARRAWYLRWLYAKIDAAYMRGVIDMNAVYSGGNKQRIERLSNMAKIEYVDEMPRTFEFNTMHFVARRHNGRTVLFNVQAKAPRQHIKGFLDGKTKDYAIKDFMDMKRVFEHPDILRALDLYAKHHNIKNTTVHIHESVTFLQLQQIWKA